MTQLTPHVLKAVTSPRQRLGISESALVVPFMVTILAYLLSGGRLWAVPMAWLMAHGVMAVICSIEPHYMYLRRGQRYPKTRRRVNGKGAVYGA